MNRERLEIENKEEWREWYYKIPNLKFKSEWEVRIIPPFGGALVRFMIFQGDNWVSVYLDVNDSLGCVGEPYWEVYPYEEDVQRVLINNTDELMKAIQESLDEQLTTNKE